MKAMRLIPICWKYQKTRNISRKQILEMSLSEGKTVNLRSLVRDSHLPWMKLLMRKQKTPTAGTSAKMIRLPSVRQQMQKTSPTAGCLRREDQTARRSVTAIQKSSQVPRAAPAPASAPTPVPAPAPPIGSRVTRSQGKVSAEALTASATDPFTYAEAMQSPQRDHWKEPWRKKAHGSGSTTPSPRSIPGKHGNCKLGRLAVSRFTRLNTILTGPHGTEHG